MIARTVLASVGLTKRYGQTVGLHPLDLEIGPGVTGLLGPNGAGKTTLLRLLCTESPPSAGSIQVLGRSATDSAAERTEVRRRIGYLPQELVLPRTMTAFSFLDYIAVLKEWAEPAARHAEVRRALGLVGLDAKGGRRTRALSGGERRRLALAQALIGDPVLLLLDEPTTGLDPAQRADLRGLLSDRGARGAVLLATHQTDDVAALCERVIVLDSGRVHFDGTVSAFVERAAGRVWLHEDEVPGAQVAWRTGTGQMRSIGGAPPDDARPAEPTVEDAYLLTLGAGLRGRQGAEV